MSKKMRIFVNVVAAENCPHYVPVRFVEVHGADRCAWCIVKSFRKKSE